MPASIKVCMGRWCAQHRLLEDIEELTKTAGCFNLSSSRCFGICRSAPNLEVKVNDSVTEHRRVQKSELVSILQKARDSTEESKSGCPHRSSDVKRKQPTTRLPAIGGVLPSCDEPATGTGTGPQTARIEAPLEASSHGFNRGNARSPAYSVYLGNTFESSDLQTLGWKELFSKWTAAFKQRYGCVLPRTLKAFSSASSSNTFSKSANVESSRPLSDKIHTWRIDRIDVVSSWSAIYRCSSPAPTKSTLAPGRQTWHVIMFAQIGEDSQGMVQRAYTPISTIQQWEQGRCDLLVKIYPNGKMTSWLYTKTAGDALLFSGPKATLPIPALTLGPAGPASSSIVLVAGGTGIAAAWQVLERYSHEDLLDIPVTLIYSCRQSDVLMLQTLQKWALDDQSARQQRRKALLAVTEPVGSASSPFPRASVPPISACKCTTTCGGLAIVDGRIREDLMSAELAALPKPIRVVICGPEPMNFAIEQMLFRSSLAPSLHITVLEA